MRSSLTSEQILSLAVDKYAIRTARTWAARGKWLRIGQDQEIAWGEFNGKGKLPIQTMVSLTKPLFSCTCTGRKLPCSHAVALRLLHFDTPHLFQPSVPSASSKASQSITAPAGTTSSGSADKAPSNGSAGEWIASLSDPAATLGTAPKLDADTDTGDADAARLRRIRKGLDELDLWLGDVVRNGLESVRDKKRIADWQRVARRLVDAQASELAIIVRKLSTIPGTTPSWPEELLAKMGTLHLLVQGFRNYEELPTEVQGDLRLAVGWLPKLEPVDSDSMAGSVVADRWHVVARQPIIAGRQRRHKIWLWGEESNRPALIVRILTNKQKQIEGFVPGTVLAGSLYFYPSMAPTRAEIMGNVAYDQHPVDADDPVPQTFGDLTITQPRNPAIGYSTLEAAFQAVNHASTQNPWIEEFPILVRSAQVEHQVVKRSPDDGTGNKLTPTIIKVNPLAKQIHWSLTDATGIRLPLPHKFEYGWHLKALAQANNEPDDSGSVDDSVNGPVDADKTGIHLFGVWDRKTFTPYSVWQGGRWLSLHILKGEA